MGTAAKLEKSKENVRKIAVCAEIGSDLQQIQNTVDETVEKGDGGNWCNGEEVSVNLSKQLQNSKRKMTHPSARSRSS
jgi:hypothetical protein